MRMNLELDGKVFFVTGAARGIGASATKILADAGAKVAACDRDKGRLEAMYNGSASNDAVMPVYADIARQNEIQSAVDACHKRFGRIDGLLHFAAVLDGHNIDQLTPEIWDSVMSVNLRGSYLVVQSVLAHMRAQGGGHIVLTASDSARMGSLVSGPAYAASKGGVIALTHTLALYLGPSKITVNAVCPGLAMTGMSKGWQQGFIDGIVKRTPLGRLAQPDDVAKVAVFLASDAAGFMTGEVVEVNGGIHFD
jgi:3-oxoacyl-[acyl-carrier protein] reductase